MPDEVQTDFTGDPDIVWAWLRKPFKPEQIGKLPATQKRPALDFIGHAAVTDRLNKVAPGQWTYTIDERFDHGGQCWVRITLTILGISRTDYGDGVDPKEALGNAIRRAAMRFGVGIDLWSREELEPATAAGPAVRHDTAAPAVAGPQSGDTASAAPEKSPAGAGKPMGKGPAPVGDHAHVWADSPTLSKFEICMITGCLETRRKQVAS